MKRKRYSTEQIVAAMKQHELGTPAADIIRTQNLAMVPLRPGGFKCKGVVSNGSGIKVSLLQ